MISTSWEQLVQTGLPVARPVSEVVAAGLRTARRELELADVAARQSVLLDESGLEAGLDDVAAAAAVLTRTRLRFACDVADRGLHVGTGHCLADWLALRCPDLTPALVRDVARLAGASTEAVHAPLVAAATGGAMGIARAARIHRALARVRKAVGEEDYQRAVDLLVAAGSDPVFDEADITRIIDALLRATIKEKDHDEKARTQHQARDVHESSLADGTVRRIIMTFGDDADYEAVKAVLDSPLAAPASRQEQEATGVAESRTPGQRRYDALMTVLRRGVAGSVGQPTTPKAQLVVTMSLEELTRKLLDPDGGRTGAQELPAAGATLRGATITAATVRRLACDADIIPMVLGGPSEIVDQGRRRRLVTPAQRLRLAIRDKGCTIPGCTIPATWCDAHHVTHWAHGGTSDLSNYALLCPRHHTWVHEHGLTATVTALGVIWLLRP